MNRRNFLQSLSAFVGALALPWRGKGDTPKPTTVSGSYAVRIDKASEPSRSIMQIQSSTGTKSLDITGYRYVRPTTIEDLWHVSKNGVDWVGIYCV